MKLTRHQKDIVKSINSKDVFDVYSYLKYFDLLKTFSLDTKSIEEDFKNRENGKLYHVLKPGKEQTFLQFDPETFSSTLVYKQLNDEDYEMKPAELDYSNTKVSVDYDGQIFTFQPANAGGVQLAASIDKIIEFLTIWSFLKKELLVLELPKPPRQEEIGVFFKSYSAKIKCDTPVKQIESLNDKGFTPYKLPEGATEYFTKMFATSDTPKVDAMEFVDEFIRFDNDTFESCKPYLCNKIVPTPDLNLFIKRRYRTNEQSYLYYALIPAYLAIVVSIILQLCQKPDNSEVVKVQRQLVQIEEHSSTLEGIQANVQELLDEIDSLRVRNYGDNEIRRIYACIRSLIQRIVG